ncbi:hypothetical protein HKCCE3408_15865 [Rhodobacterales bacterium HKCCE3408]|nr:hypothetical protein [Rhodobacterales bacterium HKCCE3408]
MRQMIDQLRDRPGLRRAWTVGGPVSAVLLAVIVTVLHPEARTAVSDTFLGRDCQPDMQCAR